MGEGSPTVVLEAGLGGTTLDWVLVQPAVAAFTRVCSYDRGGYGWSEPSPSRRTAQAIVTELERLLDYARLPPPYVLVGHSFGGLVVQLFARERPAKTAGLVLVDSTHESQFERFEAAGIENSFTPRPGRRFVITNYSRVHDGLPDDIQPIAQALALTPDAVASLYDELRYMRHSAGQVRAAQSMPDVPLWVLARDTQPQPHSAETTLAAQLWREMQEDLASRTRQATLMVVESSGHYIQLEQPQVIVDAIRAVVEASRSQALE